jgi:hypothetical protein
LCNVTGSKVIGTNLVTGQMNSSARDDGANFKTSRSAKQEGEKERIFSWDHFAS